MVRPNDRAHPRPLCVRPPAVRCSAVLGIQGVIPREGLLSQIGILLTDLRLVDPDDQVPSVDRMRRLGVGWYFDNERLLGGRYEIGAMPRKGTLSSHPLSSESLGSEKV